jgi:hypothetical protein
MPREKTSERRSHGGGEPVDRRFLPLLREAEVEHLQTALVVDHDVRRLQVAMGDVPVVRRPDRVRQWNCEVEESVEGQAPVRLCSAVAHTWSRLERGLRFTFAAIGATSGRSLHPPQQTVELRTRTAKRIEVERRDSLS